MKNNSGMQIIKLVRKMKKVVVLGENEFTLGFELAGVDCSFKLNDTHPEETINELISNREIGLIVMEEKTMAGLNETMREKLSQSIEPVFLVLSVQDTNEELRRLIKKSIGVDLWNK
jgi:V/A-type H+/Na+-transporting ATPase subunit F